MIDKNATSLSLLPCMKRRKEHLMKVKLTLKLAGLLFILLLVLSCRQAAGKETGRRYVVLSPEIAEIIAVIEGTDNVVGITEECTYPASYAGKKVVGKFGTLDRESIIALKPDIVFASSLEQQSIATELAKLDIKVVTVYPKSIEEMLQGIVKVGKAIGKKARAEFVADSLRTELDKIRNSVSGQRRCTVYLEIYREPLMSVSDKSFVGELLELAGLDNVFSELERDYCRISSEDVIRANPVAMICYSKDTRENIRSRKGWQDVPFVRDNLIFFEEDINPDLILRAGPRCVEGAKLLQKVIYGKG
jgi:iron complex transport system substrate-binding protein